MNPMLKIAYDYGCQMAVEDFEKNAGSTLNRVFSDLSGVAGAGITGALTGASGGALSAALNDPSLDGDDLLRSMLIGAGGGAVTGSLGTALQSRLRGADLDDSLAEYDQAAYLLNNRRSLDKAHAAHIASTVRDLEDELKLLRRKSPSRLITARKAAIRSNIDAIKNEPASVFGANKFHNAESALSSDLSNNKARAIASVLLSGGLGSLGGYRLNELIED
jgi:hypothetical protein